MWDEVFEGLLLADVGCGEVGREKAYELVNCMLPLVSQVVFEICSREGIFATVPLIDIDFDPARGRETHWAVIIRPDTPGPLSQQDYDKLRSKITGFAELALWALRVPGSLG